MKLKNYVIVFDCETGGLDEKQNPITEIALCKLNTLNWNVEQEYETYVKPYENDKGEKLIITKDALKASTVSMTDILAGIDSKKLVKTLITFFKGAATSTHPTGRPMLAGHNVGFDIRMLGELFRLNEDNLFNYVADERIDTLTLSKKRWETEIKSDDIGTFNLMKCCERYGIPLLDAHGAMPDVKATTKLVKALLLDLRNAGGVSKEVVSTEEQAVEVKTRGHYNF